MTIHPFHMKNNQMMQEHQPPKSNLISDLPEGGCGHEEETSLYLVKFVVIFGDIVEIRSDLQ
jgi:hypothetical protein